MIYHTKPKKGSIFWSAAREQIAEEKDYRGKANDKTPSISSYPRERYEEFFERFFLLAHQKVKETTRIAFLNADWRDFQSTPALKENEGKAITIFDYHRILSKTGWKVTHRIECPLSSERMSGNEVQKMQEKRILGTVGRSILIAKRWLNHFIARIRLSKSLDLFMKSWNICIFLNFAAIYWKGKKSTLSFNISFVHLY